ncbi:MAG: sigma factor [Candidatus Nanopelagicaceae bacterium]
MARKAKQFQLSKEQQKLASDNINLARREAWRLQRTTDIDYDTLEGAALEGLCKAAHRYDPSSGYKFSSLAVPTIRGELLHWIRDKTYSMRLTHKMRETWIKGRKLLYKGYLDDEIADALQIASEEWQEIKGVCSGPPLELNDQASPTESLEPEEINFAERFQVLAKMGWSQLDEQEQNYISNYFNNLSSRIPHNQMKVFVETSIRFDI